MQEGIAETLHDRGVESGNFTLLAMQLLQFREDVKWYNLEDFVRRHRALRVSFLLWEKRDPRAVPLATLKSGAWLSGDLQGVTVNIAAPGSGKVSDLSFQFPFQKESFDVELGKCYLNGEKAKFGDVFEVFEMSSGAGSPSSRSIIVYECRHSRPDTKKPPGKVTIDQVKTAVDKAIGNLAAASTENEEMRQFSVGAVGFFSNRMGAEDLANSVNLPLKSFVVVEQNAVSYFGKSLAMRFLGQVDDMED
jgi:hypothetical protein